MGFLIQAALSAANKAGKRALHFIMDTALSCKVEAIRFQRGPRLLVLRHRQVLGLFLCIFWSPPALPVCGT